MKRPAGVTVISILQFIAGAFCVLFAILAFAGGGMLATVMSQSQAQGGGALGAIAGAGLAVIGVVILALGVLYGLTGWGMLGLKNWARMVTIVFTAIAGLWGIWGMISHFSIVSLIVLAFYAWVIWYLVKPDVAGAFKGTQSAAASA